MEKGENTVDGRRNEARTREKKGTEGKRRTEQGSRELVRVERLAYSPICERTTKVLLVATSNARNGTRHQEDGPDQARPDENGRVEANINCH